MSSSEVSTARATLTAVLGVGVEGAAADFPDRPLRQPDWEELIALVRAHRLSGLMAVAANEGQLPVEPSQRDEVLALHASAMEMCLLLEADLLVTSAVLDEARVEHRVLKGPASAHLDYPDPSWRLFGDIDLLVRSDQFDLAVSTLEAAGHRRRFREVRTGFDRRFGKGVCLDGPTDRETDLHRTFAMGPFGLTIDLPQLWSTSRTFALAGRTFTTLDPDARFVHACYHAALGRRDPGLVPLRDMVSMLQRREDPVSVDRVLQMARQWRAEAVVARAVRLAWGELGMPSSALSTWADAHDDSPADRRALRTYLDPSMGYAAREFAALRTIRSPRDKIAFAWALLVPDRTYGGGRHGRRSRRLAEALRQVRQLVSSRPPP